MSIQCGRSGSVWSRGIAIVCGLALASSIALAQDGPRRGPGGPGGPGGDFMREMQRPALTLEDLNKYADTLALTADQKEAAKALIETAQEEIRTQGEAMREEFRRMREEGGPGGPGGPGGGREGMRERMEKQRAQREKIDATLLADMKSILTPEQEAKWPIVERARRRDAVGRRGMMSGERVDLIDITRRASWSPEIKAKLAGPLEQYEMDLDRLLVQREGVYERGMREMRDRMRDGNMEAAQKQMDEGRQASQRVRDLNQRVAREIAGLLPEAERATFELEVKKASFPRIYRTRPLERQIEAAAKLSGLSDAQKGELAQLSEAYGRDLTGLRDKQADATVELESKATIETFMDREWDERGPMRELQDQRRTLERSTEDKLKKILGPDLMEKLPSARDDDEDDRPRRGDGPGRRRGQS